MAQHFGTLVATKKDSANVAMQLSVLAEWMQSAVAASATLMELGSAHGGIGAGVGFGNVNGCPGGW